MPRNNPDYLEIHRQADRIEPRLARAVVRATARLQNRIPKGALLEALESGDPTAVAAVLEAVDVADVYVPAGRIVEDTVLKGAKVAEADINEERQNG